MNSSLHGKRRGEAGRKQAGLPRARGTSPSEGLHAPAWALCGGHSWLIYFLEHLNSSSYAEQFGNQTHIH